jgi:predicted MFS family arabinose efflux permease
MTAVLPRLAQPVIAFREAFRSPDLRRLELALGCWYAAEWAYIVALGVFAYRHGGALAVGIVGFIRMVPGALAVPFASLVSDRSRREQVLLAMFVARAALLVGSALTVLTHGPPAVVYLLAGLGALASAAFRPSHWAIMPQLARTPAELVAGNAASSTTESLAIVIGPALAALVLAARGVGLVFVICAAAFVAGALAIALVQTESGPGRRAARTRLNVLRESFGGFSALGSDPHSRLLIGLFAVQTFVRGALNVLIVVAAIELLEMGNKGVGFLNAGFGVGGLIGAVAALGLTGRRRLGHPFGLGLVLWGAPIALVALSLRPALALFWLALVGVGNSVLDVAGFTLVQRLVPDQILARVFGVLETLAMAAVGVGALLTPVLIDSVGGRKALVVTGAILPALALLFWRRFGQIDDATDVPEREVALLRANPIFAPLPMATAERLAARLQQVLAPAGTVIVREGEPGDHFYLIASGEVEVTAAGRRLATLGPGDSLGEIALLRDVPRTATGTAQADSELYALDREEFVGAVSGHAQSARTADAVVGTRLDALGARLATG